MGERALTPAQMTTNLRTHLRAATKEDKRHTVRAFRLRGAASHGMDGTARDILTEYQGVEVRHRCVGMTASAAAAGVNRSREAALMEADALRLSEQRSLRNIRSQAH